MNIEHLIDGCNCMGKYCPNCTHVICILGFNKNTKAKDKLQTYCRDCDHAYHEQWRKDNKDKHRLRIALWNSNNREKVNGIARKWRENNPEEARTVAANSRTKHKDAYEQMTQEWRENNPERLPIYRATRRTRKTQAGGCYTVAEWSALKAQYDYQCLCCGKSEPEIKLCADHVIPVIKGGTSNIDNIQPLCRPCNSRKRARIIDYRKTHVQTLDN